MAVPSVPCLCPGGTVVCIASGPSLTAEDVAWCRDRADAVVAVNDAHRMAPWATVLYSSDQHWWAFYQGVPSFAGRKVGIAPLVPAPEWGITVLQNTGMRGLETQPTGLRNGRHSGYAAVNLAVHLGARRIVLLGYDLGPDAEGRMHFFGAHPDALLDRGDNRATPFDTFLAMFETLALPLQQIGVAVVNASRRSALRVFPRRPLEEVW